MRETAFPLQEVLGLCDTPASAEDADSLMGWIQDGIETMVQYGYPYPTSFYNPVPGYPFKVACERMVADGAGNVFFCVVFIP
eukprot:COSAG06_NODE_9117_length_1969_cov_1.535847_1_plen_82_part_00